MQAASAKKPGDAPILVAEPSGPESLDGERKTVTALFADIKGSMDMIEDLDPEEARAIVDPALKLMRPNDTAAMWRNPLATAYSLCSAHQSPMSTIRSARSTRHSGGSERRRGSGAEHPNR